MKPLRHARKAAKAGARARLYAIACKALNPNARQPWAGEAPESLPAAPVTEDRLDPGSAMAVAVFVPGQGVP